MLITTMTAPREFGLFKFLEIGNPSHKQEVPTRSFMLLFYV
jgi:hypothetical protein